MSRTPGKNNIEAEFVQIDSIRAWTQLYQRIRDESLNNDYTLIEAKKAENKNLNRYRDVSPYDHSRVVLTKGSCNYINANLITMERAHRRYILTQGPLPHTTGHFWLMIWEQKCKAVLMLNRIIEKNQVKCHQYWPSGTKPGVDDRLELKDVGLVVEFVSETEASYYTTRVLRLIDEVTGESRQILQFHYTTWPDFGVPESPTAFLNFLTVVRQSGALDQNVGPPVVHCSAGIGRSGTFCLVDSCLVLIEENGLDSVNVVDVLLEMRKFRMGLIQTPDQLRFSYLAIIEGAKKLINNNPLHDYNNVEDTSLNHHDGSTEETSADEDDTDEPPPLPPPRGDSLTRSKLATNNHGMNGGFEANKPLPVEPEVSPEQESVERLLDSALQDKEASDDTPQLRHRRHERQERLLRLTGRIREIKRKQEAAEHSEQLWRSLSKPLAVGFGLGLVMGGGWIAYCYFSNRV
ncbi:tyrosine-protein phosphatase non-receptor type 2-like isoform X1 [Schistocerca nitens]|uniref:tyrosine-protein phosphatase non-receptor type 2-like isoform X1 n=1 Tax=Schistocerca nitens TaxID=7011 RepID=UPI00211812A1|nr:tyrosine-protein phosphatase non-receptor type 2-like isoform X1 [Schistocerca nitens]XP_049811715.1 tyrosine-protein phosphatase non-receptor type 2-like isoform X1 [Schistocerca nitens]